VDGRVSTVDVAAQCIHSRPHTVSVWSCLGRAEAPGPAAAVDAISLYVSERHGLVFGAAAVRKGVSCRRRHRRRRQLTTPVPPAHHSYPGICKVHVHGAPIHTRYADDNFARRDPEPRLGLGKAAVTCGREHAPNQASIKEACGGGGGAVRMCGGVSHARRPPPSPQVQVRGAPIRI
jgi:hypothetical protein